MPVVKCELNWVYLAKPSDMSGKYQLDASNLSEKDVAFFEKEGVPVQNETEPRKEGAPVRGHYVTMKAHATTYDGKPKDPPKIVDAHKRQLARDLAIGNGTTAKVAFDVKPWEFQKKTGFRAELKAVQILELVKFGSGVSDFEEEEGYEGEEVLENGAIDEFAVPEEVMNPEDPDDPIPY